MSLMHNIRNFAEIQLQGIIPWSKFSFPDETHTDVANVSIDGKHGLYRIVVSSSYAVPPLGNVTFNDNASGHEIEGENQDGTWHRIAEYLKAREAGDETLDAKRRRESLAYMDIIKPILEAAKQGTIIPLPVSELQIPPVAFVYYLSDPGVWYQNGPALVTRVNADGSYNLTVFPDGSEPFYRQNVGERSDRLKNVCWVAYEKVSHNSVADHVRIAAKAEILEGVDTDMSPGSIAWIETPDGGEISKLREMIESLQETIGRIKASAFDQRKSA